MTAVFTLLKTFLTAGTVRRWGVGLVVMGVLALNTKLGLDLTVEAQSYIAMIATALILGSNGKSIAEMILEAKNGVASSKPEPTTAEAAEAIAKI